MVDKHRANPRSSLRPIALRCGDTALCLRSRHTPQKSRSYGLKALPCTCMTFQHTTREPEWPCAGPFERDVKIERVEFRRLVLRCPR